MLVKKLKVENIFKNKLIRDNSRIANTKYY